MLLRNSISVIQYVKPAITHTHSLQGNRFISHTEVQVHTGEEKKRNKQTARTKIIHPVSILNLTTHAQAAALPIPGCCSLHSFPLCTPHSVLLAQRFHLHLLPQNFLNIKFKVILIAKHTKAPLRVHQIKHNIPPQNIFFSKYRCFKLTPTITTTTDVVAHQITLPV